MNLYDPLCYTVNIEVNLPAPQAFEYLSDPQKIGRWALGCFDTQPTRYDGLYKGTSLFDRSEAWVRVETDLVRLIIDYHVGDPNKQVPRISTRVIPGEYYGKNSDHCIVIMTAWRMADMSDQRWHRLCVTHDAEILLIKSQLEQQSEK
ncbi:MAG: hypothetical protein JSW26_21695 [Desulfobacterales bacterium]|nr:MAG: hypothetical protein JSW26_21695 [Desulfobacterales bacterium]